MTDYTLRSRGHLIQFVGLLILLAGVRGFFIFKSPLTYFPCVIIGIVAFAACLFKGGAIARNSKKLGRSPFRQYK